MSSSANNKQQEPNTAMSPSPFPIPTDLLLSLATAPMLLGILSIDAIFGGLESAGVSSEEIFRGERLPMLHFPDTGCED